MQCQQHAFNHLSKGEGKGNKNSLKQVRKVKENGEVEEMFQDRKSIEQAMAKWNVSHFRQAFESKAYEDKHARNADWIMQETKHWIVT